MNTGSAKPAYCRFPKYLVLILLAVCFYASAPAQENLQTVKGTVYDRDTRNPVSGAYVIIRNSSPVTGTVTDTYGNFRLKAPYGRISIDISFIGYEQGSVNDILVRSGKEIEITVELTEKLVTTGEIVVRGKKQAGESINPMAAVSTHNVRTDDALRFAGGFYDPARIVNGFAGVVTANNDESNDIVIRGNSSRGLLWRLEGIEIPNPNHFGDGQGGSGGAYSAITTNAISSFDFFTGAFPAEYGNAVSGVMDLTLRKGNSEAGEYAFQTGMIGAELSAEGPLAFAPGSSYLVDARYVNFGFLERAGLIDLGSTNFAPRSGDVIFNINIPHKKRGTYNLFGFYGESAIGKKAVKDITKWQSQEDRWEEMQFQSTTVAGLRHVRTLGDNSGYFRNIIAFTGFTDRYGEGYVDSSFQRSDSYHHNYSYPSLKFSSTLNARLGPGETVRTGVTVQLLFASMEQWRRGDDRIRKDLVRPAAAGLLYQFYFQFRNRITERLEINSGIHTMAYSINKDISIEPRVGLKWKITPVLSIDAGAGIHSRTEAMPVYFNYIKNSAGKNEVMNSDLEFSKSFQQVVGFDLYVSQATRIRIEAYNQHLYSVPAIDNRNSTYSSINTSEELPASDLKNIGLGYNRGLELTVEKQFSDNYYFLITGSVFDSKYRPGTGKWYNTYYNNSFVSNILIGKDIVFGKDKRSVIGLNMKVVYRGGYRYTPVDYDRSYHLKKVVYVTDETYGKKLPDFLRADGGLSYRRNGRGFSWILMADIQNITSRKNIFRKRFSYTDGHITENNVVSLGAIPVGNFRIEF